MSEEAEKIFDSAERGDNTIVVPSIVVAESIYIAEKRGYSLQMMNIIEDLEISSNYTIGPMNYSILRELTNDDRGFSIHDNIIVHTAEKKGHKIISRDDKIQKKAEVEVIW